MPQIRCKPPIGIPNALPKRPTVSRVQRIACLGSCGIQTTRWGVGGKIAPGERRWEIEKRMEWMSGQQQQSCWRRGFRTTTRTNSSTASSTEFKGTPKRSNAAGALAILFGASAVAVLAAPVASYVQERIDAIKHIEEEENVEFDEVEDSNDVAHKFRLEEVSKHDQHADYKWVISGSSVYDITDFVDCHPGGKVILRACGGSIDPYWKLFSIHQKPEVRKILEDFYIGDIDEKDLKDDGSVDWSVIGLDANAVDDPFKDDPERCADLNILTAKPCNAETPGRLLADFITPLRLFFVRNHLWVPKIDPKEHALQIELSNGQEISFSLEDLKTKFQHHSITVTLQCAGNRRSHMNNSSNGKTSGIAWDVGAIGTAEFTGVRLRDVLLASGYDVDTATANANATPSTSSSEKDSSADRHIHLCAPSDTYEQSIPLATALSPTSDVLLAWEMNSAPLPRDHGGPLRAIVPGTIATRSVKWLGKIRLSPDESNSNWHTRDYKLFGPEKRCAKDATEQDWREAEAIHDCPVQSATTSISPSHAPDSYTVSGFAYSGGGRRILRVDVSADGGKSWKAARLRKDDEAKGSKRWAWTRWEVAVPRKEEGSVTEFVVKATDESCNCQPESFEGSWNFRGLLGNAWHRVQVGEEEGTAR